MRELGLSHVKSQLLHGSSEANGFDELDAGSGVVGLYYLGRSLAIALAAFVGGLLWRISPELPFYVAAGAGVAGVLVFTVTVSEQDAG